MKQKKVLRVWQMIVISVLLAALCASMFFPIFSVTGKKVVNMQKNISERIDDYIGFSIYDFVEDSGYLEKQTKDIDKKISEFKKKEGINLSYVSLFDIMNGKITKFFEKEQKKSDNDTDERLYKNIAYKFKVFSVLLWIFYSLTFILLILVIIGFIAKWSKYINLIIDMIYSVGSTVLFSVLFFCQDGIISGKIVKYWGKGLDLSQKGFIRSIISNFTSYGFLFAALIAFCLIIICFISMFTGNRAYIEEIIYPEYPYPLPTPGLNEDGDGIGYGFGDNTPLSPEQSGINKFYNGGIDNKNSEMGGHTPQKGTISLDGVGQQISQKNPVKQNQAVPPAPKVGVVRCVSGVATGQGFSLPSDRKVIVGKSVNKANLVINNPNVSNIHCSIRYDDKNDIYVVKDHSTNGTYVNGNRLPKDQSVKCSAGTILSLSDGKNQIRLG